MYIAILIANYKKDSSERDAGLVVVAKSAAKTNTPTIITGNLMAWSTITPLFRKISGLLDPRVGRSMFNTFPADLWFCADITHCDGRGYQCRNE